VIKIYRIYSLNATDISRSCYSLQQNQFPNLSK